MIFAFMLERDARGQRGRHVGEGLERMPAILQSAGPRNWMQIADEAVFGRIVQEGSVPKISKTRVDTPVVF